MSLSMPPTTDAIAPQTFTPTNVEAKTNNEVEYTRNNRLESLQIDGNDEDPDDYPEGGTTAWLVVLGAWCMYNCIRLPMILLLT